MTIIEVVRTSRKPTTGELLKKIVSNRCCLSVLRFFTVHPNSRFNKLAIVHGLDEHNRSSEVENALTQLVKQGVLCTRTENTVCYFHLTRDETIREVLLSMAGFDWHQWRMILEHI
ncbi:MAG: hypothetical protein A2Z29_07165 [Chloroflexi bacterium RBG_16_56_11]|nr:MAG: hypothetical protein A2Z29_07165 [Chloroflexi bacterium RBG_16_56_11]